MNTESSGENDEYWGYKKGIDWVMVRGKLHIINHREKEMKKLRNWLIKYDKYLEELPRKKDWPHMKILDFQEFRKSLNKD
jgi:hypothetical protein